MSELLPPSCLSCMLSLPVAKGGDYPAVRCVRFSRNVAENHCCTLFLAPSAGYRYPEGSRRDAALSFAAESVPMAFSSWRGLEAVK